MGVDLRLLIIDGTRDGKVPMYSHSMLSLSRSRDLWEPIGDIEQQCGRDVPADFSSFVSHDEDGEHCYGQTTTTPYGETLKYVTVADLLSLESHKDVRENSINRAAWVWMKAMPPDAMVALYWH